MSIAYINILTLKRLNPGEVRSLDYVAGCIIVKLYNENRYIVTSNYTNYTDLFDYITYIDH